MNKEELALDVVVENGVVTVESTKDYFVDTEITMVLRGLNHGLLALDEGEFEILNFDGDVAEAEHGKYFILIKFADGSIERKELIEAQIRMDANGISYLTGFIWDDFDGYSQKVDAAFEEVASQYKGATVEEFMLGYNGYEVDSDEVTYHMVYFKLDAGDVVFKSSLQDKF